MTIFNYLTIGYTGFCCLVGLQIIYFPITYHFSLKICISFLNYNAVPLFFINNLNFISAFNTISAALNAFKRDQAISAGKGQMNIKGHIFINLKIIEAAEKINKAGGDKSVNKKK